MPPCSRNDVGREVVNACHWGLHSLNLCALADVLKNYAEACAKLASTYRAMGGNLDQPRFYPFIQMRFPPFIVQNDASTNRPDIDGSP